MYYGNKRYWNQGGKVMQITDVRVRKITKEGKMKAIVSITLDEEFVVHDIKVIEGDKGLFIAMPSKKASDGEYRDIAHPINSSTRDNIQRTILDNYVKALALSEEETEQMWQKQEPVLDANWLKINKASEKIKKNIKNIIKNIAFYVHLLYTVKVLTFW